MMVAHRALALALIPFAFPVLAAEPLDVVVSIPPQREIVTALGGDLVRVEVLIPPGRSPATFEPNPRQMVSVSTADLLIPLGLPFERQVVSRLNQLNPALPSCPTSHETAPTGGDPHRSGHNHESLDPHFWLDPRATEAHAAAVRDCLCRVRPSDCARFDRGLAGYVSRLEDADRRIGEILAPYAGKTLLVFHPAFGHFAARYGLDQVAIEFEGKSPNARQLATVIDEARRHKVGTVFVQRQFASSGAQAVADAIGADVVELDPLAPDLVDNLVSIADTIAAAFARDRERSP